MDRGAWWASPRGPKELDRTAHAGRVTAYCTVHKKKESLLGLSAFSIVKFFSNNNKRNLWGIKLKCNYLFARN